MTTRNLGTGTALKNSLIANEEYGFFHLVKFEKPKNVTAPGFSSGKASNYAYITDSSIDIDFNDGSKDSKNTPNGSQTYIANKLLSVGTINETTDAKASNMTVTMSGTALGTIVQTSAAFTTSSMTTTTDLVDAGFQEGDVLLLESAGVDNKYIRINTFTNGNQTVAFSNIDSTVGANSESKAYTLSFASEEISALVNNKDSSTNYSGYMNREVFIYRAHYRTETEYAANGTTIVNHAGSIIGEPFLIFRGIISKGSVTDDVLKSSKVSWNLTSHWGDFVRVQGRHTSDASHRALSITGVPDMEAIVRPEYASDFGFLHAERSVNVLATYQVQETRYKMKKRGGLAGLFGGKKTVEYQVEVDREVDLQFNLEAKYLPVVYGVQKVDSIPIFADTLKDSVTAVSGSNTVFVAHAICEGEISGIYDIHVEDNSTICIDANDASVRDGGSEAVEVVCYGRADRGDVLAGSTAYGDETPFYTGDLDFSISPAAAFLGVNASTFALLSGSGLNFPRGQTASGNGLQHEDTFTLSSPIPTTLTIHTGKEDQRANNTLTTTAKANNFKLQNDFGDVSKANYWSPSHRLLDTAYVVGKYEIGEGESTIPKLEFIVKGKKIETYNYDYSYETDPTRTNADHSNFALGDTVTLHTTSTGSSLGTVTIIDKWSYYRDSSSLYYRFRFSANPQVAAGTTAFYMKKGSHRWYMTTYDHQADTSFDTLPAQSAATVATVSNAATGTMTINLASNTSTDFLNTLAVGHYVTFTYEGNTSVSFQVRSRSGNDITVYNSGASVYALSTAIGNSTTVTMNNLNVIILNSSASSSNDAYNSQNITIFQFDSDGTILKQQVKLVTDYIGNTRQATLQSPLPVDFILGTTDRYIVSAGEAVDKRVSINPALQLLDYLKNDRYGKGLLDSDINLPTFLQAARDCDTRSDITVQLPGNISLTDGDVYRYPSSGSLQFQGKIRSSFSKVAAVPQSNGSTINTTFTEVTFTDVVGKLGYKWNNYRVFNSGQLYWHKGEAYVAQSNSAITSAPTSSSSDHLTGNLSLAKVGGGTAITVSITDGFSASGNPIVKKFTNIAEGFNSPGYSLYDSDDVKYWIYVGWDEPEQRFVTRHQLNQIIDTANPLFDNINSMLKQFNGIMRYANGKYELAVKSAAPSSFESFETITDGDIIGKIKLQDKGQKGIYNSMSANVVDPQNKFNARAITYFNSEYLKQDKGIRKSGNFKMPGVSNYFNSRVNIQQFLDESRYGLDISFTIDSKGYLLLTGEIIRLTYERFGWENKYFRIDNLNFQSNGLVQVTATEHNNNAFLVGNIKSSQETGALESEGGFVNTPIVATPASPSNLAATTNGKGSITVTWNNSSTFKLSTHNTEVWASSTNNRSNASLIFTTQATSVDHIIAEQTLTSKYYWIRHQVVTDNGLIVSSDYFPAGSTAGVLGSATGAIDGDPAKAAILTANQYVIPYSEANAENTIITFTAEAINFDSGENRTFKFYVGTTLKQSTTTTNDTKTFVLSQSDEPASGAQKTIIVEIVQGTTTAQDSTSIYGVRDGVDAFTTVLSNEAHIIAADENGLALNYNSSGTDIRVFHGNTPLTYGTSGANTFSVAAAASSITVASGNNVTTEDFNGVTNSTRRFGVASGMANADTTASITFTITARDPAGVATTLTRVQTFIKGNAGADAKVVNLTANKYVINHNVDGNDGNTTSDITFTATAKNIGNTKIYKFYVNNTIIGTSAPGTQSSTSNSVTCALPDASEPASGTQKTIRVDVEQPSGTVIASDSTSIYGVQDGEDAFTVVLTNESHTIPATSAGAAKTYANSGTDIRVFRGSTPLTYGTSGANTFSVTAAASNITVATGSTNVTTEQFAVANDTRRFGVASGMANSTFHASITFTITARNQEGTGTTITRVQTFAKGNDGINADALTVSSSTADGVTTLTFSDSAATSLTVNSGFNSATASLYKKSTSNTTAPADPTGNFTYTFSDGSIVAQSGADLDGWSTAVPSLGNEEYAWVIQATASNRNTTDTIAASEFSDAAIHSGGGETGVTGNSNALVTLYRVHDSGSTGPTSFTGTLNYEFSSGNITTTGSANLQNWTKNAPAVPAGSYLWIRQASVSANTTTVDIPIASWSGAVVTSISGVSRGVKALYSAVAEPTDTNQVFETQGDREYVNFYEFTGTFSALNATQITALTFVKVKGENGDNEGVIAVYATDASGSNISFTPNDSTHTREFVNFYEWDVTKPNITDTEITSLSTFVKFVGAEGQSVKLVQLFKKDDSNFSFLSGKSASDQTYADPTNGIESGWTTTQETPANGEAIYMVSRTFTSDGLAPQTSAWTGPVIVAQRTDGITPGPGAPGLRTIQGYLYYEKTTNTSTAPTAPSGAQYNITSATAGVAGTVTGTGIGTGVNTWTNAPRTQDATSSHSYWTVRYYGQEASASSATITVAYTNIVKHTSFTGVVTFSSGTLTDGTSAFDPDDKIETGSAASDINSNTTTIDGGKITANSIKAGQLEISSLTADATGTADGIFLDGTNNNIKIFAGGVLRVKIGNLS